MPRTPALTALLLTPAALAPTALSQDLTHTAPPQDRPVYITGADVHTVSGAVIEGGVVGFDDGVITMVENADFASRFDPPQGAIIFDARGMHLYPGMLAANTQLGLTEMSAVRAQRDYNEVGSFTPEVRAAVSVNPDSTLIPVARTNGILLFASLPTSGSIPGRASVMRTDGWTWEDMTIDDDAALLVNFPAVRPSYDPFSTRSKSEREQDIQNNLDALNDFFDAATAYAQAAGDHPTDLRFDAMRAYLPSADDQKPVMISANDLDQITAAVTWAAGRELRAIILGGRDAHLCAPLLVEHDVPVIVNGTHVFPKRADAPHDDPFTLPKKLEDAGVRWCLAPADRNGNERNLPYEAARAAAFGLSPAAALRSVTLAPAEILGIADHYGSIEPGKSATIFLADADCLEVTTTITTAWIDGRQVDLSNKQTKLRDKYLDKYRQLGILDQD